MYLDIEIRDAKANGWSDTEVHAFLCQVIKCIYQDAWKVRAQASDQSLEQDEHGQFKHASLRCARYMWSTVQAHQVMREFLDLEFKNHPTISAIFTRYLATRTTSETKQLAAAEKKIEKLEKTVKEHRSILDSLTALRDRVVTLEKKVA